MKKVTMIVLALVIAFAASPVLAWDGIDAEDNRVSATGVRVSWQPVEAQPEREDEADVKPAEDPEHAYIWCGVDGYTPDCPQRGGHPTE